MTPMEPRRYVICSPQSEKTAPPDEFIAESGYEFVPRRGRSLPRIRQEYGADGVIVWHDSGPILHREGEEFFFHPGMAKNRLAAWRRQGIADVMATVSGLTAGDRCLDCTAGLGADAIVAAYFSERPVIALESEAVVALIVKWGMRCYKSRMEWLNEAIGRIAVINADHLTYLKQQPDASFDLVYFDPMFEHALLRSNAIAPLRGIANPAPLRPDSVAEARRVARRAVIMKGNADGQSLRALGFDEINVSSSGRIAYGVIKK